MQLMARRMFHWIFVSLWVVESAMAGMMLDGLQSTYPTLAAQSQFNAIGRFSNGVSGTLIASNWVLTAAHIANPTGFQVRGSGTLYSVTEVIRHPSFVANGSNLNYGYDIALIRLGSDVSGVTPATLYRGSGEVGLIGNITGYGVGGVGSDGIANLPAIERAGTNAIDALYDFADGPSGQVGAQQSAFLTDFDSPSGFGAPGQYNTLASLGSSAVATTNEYQLAPFDSGGGVFIFENGQWQLAGINSGIASQLEFSGSGNTNNLAYGSVAVYTRVSAFQGFIDANTFQAVPEPSTLAMSLIATVILWIRRLRSRTLLVGRA